MSAVLEEARGLVAKRLAELDDERQRLQRALDGLGSNGASAPKRRRRRRKSSKSSTKASGNRRDQILKAIHDADGGIGGGEIAKQIGIQPNYVYRILGELNKAGAVKKEGRNYIPA